MARGWTMFPDLDTPQTLRGWQSSGRAAHHVDTSVSQQLPEAWIRRLRAVCPEAEARLPTYPCLPLRNPNTP